MAYEYDYTIKTLIIGDSGVGKSSILNQFVDLKYSDSYQCTIGVDYKTIYTNVSDKSIKFLIWDTAGQERFKSVTKVYYRGAQVIIYVFDITDRISFENISMWIKETDSTAPNNCIKVLVGNKCDYDCDYINDKTNLQPQKNLYNNKKRQVSIEEAEEYAKLNNFIGYYETSAKKNINIEKCFLEIGNYYVEKNPTIPNNKTKIESFNISKNSLESNTLNNIFRCFC
jgi:small GTP-binding protein